MLRWLAIASMSILIVVMIVMGIGGWRVQTALANRLDALTGELSLVQQAQQQLLDRQATEIPEIRGRAYLEDASHPAANVELQILNASDLKLFRRLRTDADGQFRSHSLPAGDYFLLAPLLSGDGREVFASMPGNRAVVHHLQSQPLYVYPQTQIDALPLDLRLRFGQLSFEMVEPEGVESLKPDEAPHISYRSQFILAPNGEVPLLPADPNAVAIDTSWPLLGSSDIGPWDGKSIPAKFGGNAEEPLQSFPALLPGTYRVSMLAAVQIADDDLNGNEAFKSRWRLDHRVGFPYWPLPTEPRYYTTVDVAEGKRTHLCFRIPEGMAASVRDLFAKKSEDWKEIDEALHAMPAAVEVIGDREMLSVP